MLYSCKYKVNVMQIVVSTWQIQVLLFGTFWNFKLIYLIYLFLTALGLCCCVQAFPSCGERGLLFVAAHGLLIAVASLVAEHRL